MRIDHRGPGDGAWSPPTTLEGRKVSNAIQIFWAALRRARTFPENDCQRQLQM